MTPCPLFCKKALTQQIVSPFRPRCKVNSLHLCDIRPPQYAILWEQAVTKPCQKQKTKKWLQEGINNDKGDLYKQQRDS